MFNSFMLMMFRQYSVQQHEQTQHCSFSFDIFTNTNIISVTVIGRLNKGNTFLKFKNRKKNDNVTVDEKIITRHTCCVRASPYMAGVGGEI